MDKKTGMVTGKTSVYLDNKCKRKSTESSFSAKVNVFSSTGIGSPKFIGNIGKVMLLPTP